MKVIYFRSIIQSSVSGAFTRSGLGRVLLVALFMVAALSAAYAQAPTITSFTPLSGAVGSSVTITGTNFSATLANNTVFFGAVRATVTGATATSITATVPSGTTEQPIYVTVGGKVAQSRLPFRVTFSGGAINATTLNAPVSLTANGTPRAVAIKDMDGDGKPDLVVVNSGASNVSVYRNTTTSGAATFASKVDLPTGSNPVGLSVADIDGDNKPDIAVSTAAGSSVTVIQNTSTSGTLSFAAKFDAALPISGTNSVVLADLDNDGKPELITAGGDRLFVFRNLAVTGTIDNATFPSATQFVNINASPESVTAGDVDGDGRIDIVISSLNGGDVTMMRNTTNLANPGAYSFSRGNLPLAGSSTPSGGNVILSDLDGDGKLDIVLASGNGIDLYTFRNVGALGDASFDSYFPFSTTDMAQNASVAAADMDGDGKPDLVVGTESNKVNILKNQSTSGFIDFAAAVGYPATGFTSVVNYGIAVGDLNADSKPDVVAPDQTNAQVLIYQNGGPVLTPQTITFNALPTTKKVGDADFAPGATTTSGLTISYASSNTAVATIVSGNIHIVGAGTTTITASQAGNGTYAAAADKTQNITIGKQDQTITFNALPTNKKTGDADFAPGATASSGLTVAYASSNTSVATIVSGNIHIVGAGTTTITASQAGNGTYNPADDETQTLTVKQAQTITFNTLPTDKVVGDADFAPGATASSGLTVTYASSNTAVATIVSGNIHIVGAGSTNITASQAGNASFAAAPDQVQGLTVKQAQTITFNTLPTDKVVGDADFAPGATTTSGLTISYASSNTAVATIVSGNIHIVGAGTTTITASQAGNGTFGPADNKTQTLTVKQAQTITFNSLPAKTVGDADFAPGATTTSGLTISYASSNTAVATIVSGNIHIVGQGTSTITASQAGNATYGPAQNKTQVLTVNNKTSQTITFAALAAKTVGDANFTLSATATSGLPVSFTSSNTAVATVSGTTVTIVGAGTTTITAKQAGNGTYNPADDVPRTLTVNKKTQTITFNAPAVKTVGDAAFALGATASSGLTVSYTSSNTAVATVNGAGMVTIVGAGATTLTAKQAGNATFAAADDVAHVLTVNKKTQTINFAALTTKTVGDADFNLTATATSALAVTYVSSNTAVATIVSGNKIHIVGPGTTNIKASQAGNATFAAADDVVRELNVLGAGGVKTAQTITFAAIGPFKLGDGPITLTATASSGLPITYITSQPGVATVSGNTLTIVGVGETVITATQGGNAAFEAAASVTQTVEIKTNVVATEYEAPAIISIYPNPTSDRVTISASRFKQQSPVQVSLIDAYGRVVATESLRASSNQEVDLSTSSLSNGVYILHVTQGTFEFKNRIVKVK